MPTASGTRSCWVAQELKCIPTRLDTSLLWTPSCCLTGRRTLPESIFVLVKVSIQKQGREVKNVLAGVSDSAVVLCK